MEPTIQFTIREVLQEIRSDLADIKDLVQDKADEEEIDKLKDRVHALEMFRYKQVGIMVGFSMAAGSGASLFINFLSS